MSKFIEIEQRLCEQQQEVEEATVRKELRDKFAKAALIGLFAGQCFKGMNASRDFMAESAYDLADAMLKARDVSK